MELQLESENAPNPEQNNNNHRRSFSPDYENPVPSGPTIEELLSVKYDELNDADQTDIATTIRNAILIPNNLNVSDDCLRILCNRREHEASLVLDTTASPEKNDSPCSSQSSVASDVISDQDLRCAKELPAVVERRGFRQVSPLPKGVIISGTPILNGENSGNAVFNHIGGGEKGTVGESKAAVERGKDDLTFNGRIPAPPPPRPDHVIIQIEPDTSVEKIVEEEQVAVQDEDTATATEEPAEEEKTSAVEESFEYANEKSPDLFGDDDDADEDEQDEGMEEEMDRECVDEVAAEKEGKVDRLMQRDNHLLKRMQAACSGVLPPPSVTNVTISLDYIISKYKEHNGQLPGEEKKEQEEGAMEAEKDTNKQMYLLKNLDEPHRAHTESWPELKNVICQDVYYNLSSAIEQYESLTVKYRSRFLGTETASSFVVADISSAKKRANRTKALQQNNSSPGRRLSHLARRRAIFSCANLQGAKEAAAQAQKAAVDLSRIANRQILLPTRRLVRRTPGKKRKTPGSSTKKRTLQAMAAMNQRREALTRETSKRALFQSPGKGAAEEQSQQPVKPKVTPEVAIRVDKSKRALFSSPKFGRYPTFSGGSSAGPSTSRMELSKLRFNSMTSLTVPSGSEARESSGGGGKRKRGDDLSDEDTENAEQFKMQRTESPSSRRGAAYRVDGAGDSSSAERKRNSFMRSQSFAVEQLPRQKSQIGLARTSSDMHLGGGPVLALNDSEKKKLLWIVSQTLLRNQIDGKNPKFKEYATVMAKVVKRFYLEGIYKNGFSVSEQMAKIANNIAFQVLQNKHEVEIYSAEKLRLQAQNKKKLNGYINASEYEKYKASTLQRRVSSGIFSETSSISLSSQCSVQGGVGGGVVDENRNQHAEATTYNVLRENVDTEHRQQQQLRLSSQKAFSGKDQKNVSPYSGDSTKRKLLVGGAANTTTTGGTATTTAASALIAKGGLNVIKAKRQISFDA